MRQRLTLTGSALLCLLGTSAPSLAGPPRATPTLSTSAVVDTLKPNAPAAKAGILPGDVVLEVNGQKAKLLQEVLAARFGLEGAQENLLLLRRGKESRQVRLPQGDWGCTFRAHLGDEALVRLNGARETLKKRDAWQEGQKAWTALAEEALAARSSDAAHWLGIELGKALSASRHRKEAIEVLERWEQSAPEQGFWAFSATLELARTLQAASEFDKAAQVFARARGRVNRPGQERLLAGLLTKIFDFEEKREKLPEAKQVALEALALRERLSPGSLDVASCYHNLGMIAYHQGDLIKAKEHFLKSIAIKERLVPDSTLLTASLGNLAAVAWDQGDPATAKALFLKELAIEERLAPNTLAVANTLGNIGILAANQGDPATAKEYFLKALAIKESAVPNSLALASTLTDLGGLVSDQGDLKAAKDLYLRALAIQQRLAPEGRSIAQTYFNLGLLYKDHGDLNTAKDYQLKALALRQKNSPDGLPVASSYNDLGNLASDVGDLSLAMDYHLKALAIEERLAPDSPSVSDSFTNLGLLVLAQGDFRAARQYLLKALAIQERLAKESLSVANGYNNLGNLAAAEGEWTQARDHQLKALALYERLAPEGIMVATCLSDLGIAALGLGDLASARAHHLRALAIRERLTPASLPLATSLHNLATVTRRQGDLGAAKTYAQKALALRETLAPGSRFLAETLRELALTEEALEQRERHAELLTRAVDVLELQRTRSGGESAKTSFSALTTDFYTDLISALLRTGRPERALETLERSRARTMLEMASSRYFDLKGEIPEPLLERQRDLAHRRKTLLDRLSKATEKSDPKELDAWRSELLLLPQREDALADEIRKASPRLSALQYPKPLDLAGMQEALDPGTLLIAYAVAERETFLFTLRRPGAQGPALGVHRLNLGRKELEARVRGLRDLVGHPDSTSAEWGKVSRELFSKLLGPAVKEIGACRQILLLPDGPLHLLPFGTLIPGPKYAQAKLDGARPLGLQRPLSIQASMTIFAGLKARPGKDAASGKVAWTGIGDPIYTDPAAPQGELDRMRTRGFNLGPLPGTRAEIEGIARLFGPRAQARLGAEATKEAVLKLPREMPFLHFACHGLLDPDFPMHSSLALSLPTGEAPREPGSTRGGFLHAWEIMQDLKLETECVVLSACETGVGKVYGGEGILGLTRAFLYAGARSIVVSLWPISDESTARFMQAFYQEILAGTPRDQALLRAQARLSKRADYAHPFHWAAFVLVGSGK